MAEPLIHSHHEDGLPDSHPLAYVQLYCEFEGCDACLHAGNNECMQTWIETGAGNFCIKHGAEKICAVIEGKYVLPDVQPGEVLAMANERLDQAVKLRTEANRFESENAALRSEVVRLLRILKENNVSLTD